MPTVQDGKIRFGAEVTPDIQKVLSGCPDPDGILANIDSFNEEITETHKSFLSGKNQIDEEARLTVELARQKLGIARKEVNTTKPVVEKPKRNLSRPKKPPVQNKPVIIKSRPAETQTPIIEAMTKEESMSDSFDQEIEELDKKIEENTEAQAQVQNIGLTRNRVMEAIGKLPNAPSEALVKRWKQEFGEDGVHVTVFSEKEIYIYKHLTRSQWQKVQEMITKLQSAKNDVSEDDLKEKVVSHCILWPTLSLEWKYNSRAGVLNALYEGIMLQSYFLTPAQVMQISIEL